MDDNLKIKLALLIGVFSVFSIIYFNSQQIAQLKTYTEIYFENASIPFILHGNETYTVSFVIASHESEAMKYTYIVSCGDAKYSNIISLTPKEKRIILISFSAPPTWGVSENSSEMASEGVYRDEFEISENMLSGTLILNNESNYNFTPIFSQKLRSLDLNIINNVSINTLRNKPLVYNYLDETTNYIENKKTLVNTTVTLYVANNKIISEKTVTTRSIDWLTKNCSVTIVDSRGVIQDIYLQYKSN